MDLHCPTVPFLCLSVQNVALRPKSRALHRNASICTDRPRSAPKDPLGGGRARPFGAKRSFLAQSTERPQRGTVGQCRE
eukprot:7279296-Alexandrium_andersonii.AAC.1